MKFEKTSFKDYPEFKRFFIPQHHRICVYSLSSLLCWRNDVYQPYASFIDDDTLIIAAEFDEAHKKERHLILPISPKRQFSPEELVQILHTSGFDSYWFVPEDYIGKHENIHELFSVQEQIGFADYIYRKEDLAELKGNKYSKKRNLIHQFQKEYVNTNRISIEPLTPALCSECLEFLEEWCKEHGCDKETQNDLACEKAAAINMLKHIGDFDVKGLALRVDGKISAYGIAAHLTPEIGVFHFEKAFASIKGLYQFFDNACARELFNGYAYINKESDMNLEGLGKAKKSYHPTMMIKSYILSLR